MQESKNAKKRKRRVCTERYNVKLEQEKTDFCVNHCPHADTPCDSAPCFEFRQKFSPHRKQRERSKQ